MMQRRPRSKPTHGVINAPVPTTRPLSEEEVKFWKLVREYNRPVYYHFLEIILGYTEQRTDANAALTRIEQLFENHSVLVEGFSRLRMDVKTTNYTTKLKDRLAVNDNERYLEYFEILNGYRSGEKAMMEMIEELAMLFADHMDLFLEFCEFLPDDTFDDQ